MTDLLVDDARGITPLERVWEQTDRIFGLIAPGALLARPIPLRQPFLFYIGHLPAFEWNQLWRGILGRASFEPDFDTLFERGVDPPDDGEGLLDDAQVWPPLADVLAYRDRVRGELCGVANEPAVKRELPMVIEHELMHHETLLYMLHQLPVSLTVKPTWLPPRVTGGAVRSERMRIPAGLAAMGARPDETFRWDNEHPAHVVEVPAFAIDSVPVTNQQFLDFVEAGSYRDRRHWTPDAWRWLERRGVAAPVSWRRGPTGWRVRTLLEDLPFEEVAAWPVCASQCEASAYAQWVGGRLPTEAEFQRAAYGTPEGGQRRHPWGDAAPRAEHGNLGFRHWGPTPAGSHPSGASAFGVHELVGNGWEWTSSVFEPFPGFAPMPRYPGYSADFFDGKHFVLRGGSWATDRRLVRPSFRNWFQPHYPYVFAKFRCVHPTTMPPA